MRTFHLSPFIAALLLAACQAIPVKVADVKTLETVEIKDSASVAAIKFDRVGIKIKRGTAIGSYDPGVLGLNCAIDDGNIFWNQGRVLARDVEFEDIFFNEMKAANFNVVGDPEKMFAGATDDSKSPRYLIGGQIDDIKLEICEEISLWTGYPRGTQKGKGSVRVRWQVFNIVTRKVEYETTTQGAANLNIGAAGGEMVLFHNAFANAVVN
ncbi:MAG: hypothetical protein O3A85_06500 [Proteobacteria bacterium]|nr:hypothetical protein [Pseudomonadota bacterium]